MSELREIRAFAFECRAEENEEHGTHITGTPIVFDQVTDLGFCSERIAPGELEGCDLKDVRFLIGHDTSMVPLARSRNNNENSTMQMTVTERGMEIRVDLDVQGNPRAAELYSAVKRGDISGMSFMFTVDKDSWEDEDSDYPKRTVEHIRKVFEVSAVAFPAYEGTDIQAASEGAMLESVRASLESARKRKAEERARLEAEQAEAEKRQAEAERRRALAEWLDNYQKEGENK